MKVLLTGATGLLGRQVYKTLKECGQFSVTGTAFRRNTNPELTCVDLTDQAKLKDVIDSMKPEIIVHCAAVRWPDVIENASAEAEAINVSATQAICELAKSINSWVLYISTDYVFDGTSAPYKVDAQPAPLNRYGQMKYQGEKCVHQCNADNAVLRVPILYGPVEYLGESAVTTLYTAVRDTSKPCKMDHRQRRFPTHTENVAGIIKQMLIRHSSNPFSVKGIYHFSEPVQLSKYDMAIAMAEVMGVDSSHISADTAEPPPTATPRPYDCQLDTSKLADEGFTINTTDFRGAIKQLLS